MNFNAQEWEERRKPENRLKRISVENEKDMEGRINKWLEIADKLFGNDKDDDPTPQAA